MNKIELKLESINNQYVMLWKQKVPIVPNL